MKKFLIAGAVAAFAATTAFAQTATVSTEYYVVRDATTKKCTIVDKKPATTTEMTIVGDGKVFKTRTEAETGMKKAIDAFQRLSRTEGIIPALESAHAIAHVLRLAATLGRDQILIVNVSGRGDKDVDEVRKILAAGKRGAH